MSMQKSVVGVQQFDFGNHQGLSSMALAVASLEVDSLMENQQPLDSEDTSLASASMVMPSLDRNFLIS